MTEGGWRPAGYEERIFRHWRGKVKPLDEIIHMGDVIFSKEKELAEILASLPGIKHLVKGNHDHRSDKWYLDHGFASVSDAMVIGDVYITHQPAYCLLRDTRLNVHGHLHDDLHRLKDYEGEYPQPWHRLLALEYTDYSPVLFNEFIQTPGNFQQEKR